MPASAKKIQQYNNIPKALTARKQWVVWRDNKGVKVPYIAQGTARAKAKSNDPNTWATFKQAVAVVKAGKAHGVGYMFSADDPYVGIDLDNKADDDDKADVNELWVSQFDSYTELSPSGKGYHIIVEGTLPGNSGINNHGFEAYNSGRYFTFTGDILAEGQADVVANDRVLNDFIQTYSSQGEGEGEDKYAAPVDLEEWASERNSNLYSFFASALTRHRPFERDELVPVAQAFAAWLKNAKGGDKFTEREAIRTLDSAAKRIASKEPEPVGELTYVDLAERYVVWIKNEMQYWDEPSRQLIPPRSVDRAYQNRLAPIVDENGDEKQPSPSNMLEWLPQHRSADRLGWHPAEGPLFADSAGRICFNTYKPSVVASTTKLKKRVAVKPLAPWLEHLMYMLPDRDQREHFLDWVAYTLQHPGTKINHCVFWGSEHEGIGKDLLLRPILSAVGAHKTIRASKLEDPFNEWIWETKLLVVNEMHQSFFTLKRVENELKELLAAPPDELIVNIKHARERVVPNIVNVLFFTNERDALVISSDDPRRYFCVWSECKPKGDAYYKGLANWVRSAPNVATLYNWLMIRDVTQFNPGMRAPMTEYTKEVVQNSKGPLHIQVSELLDDHDTPFETDLFQFDQVMAALDLKPQYRKQLTAALKGLGMVQLGQAQKKGKRPYRLWAARNTEKYAQLGATALWEAYAFQNPTINKLSSKTTGSKLK